MLLEAGWIALEVQVHVVSDIFWQYRQLLSFICLGALPWSWPIPIKNFVEFRGGQIGEGASADLLLGYLTIQVERWHVTFP